MDIDISPYMIVAPGFRNCGEEEIDNLLAIIVGNYQTIPVMRKKIKELYSTHPDTIAMKKADEARIYEALPKNIKKQFKKH